MMHNASMSISVNGKRHPLVERNLACFLRQMMEGDPPQGVAIAVNDAVVPRSQWSQTEIEQGDRLEIVTAVQGG